MRSRTRFLTRPAVISVVVAVLAVGMLYGDAIRLPLFSDDLVQIPWLESISWWELWTSPSPYGYYRPLWYTIWRGWARLAGGLHPRGLHFLNLIAHGLATSLTGMLAARWLSPGCANRERVYAAGLAAALFVSFPFSRQAVAWPGAVYNPLVSGMAAAAVLAYDLGRAGRGRGWVVAALVLAALASLTYESGILVAPLIVGVELIGWVRDRWERHSWWSLAFIGLFVVSWGLWRSMRGTGVAASGLTLVDLRQNTAYLAQGLIYPFAPLAQWLADWMGADPVVAIWLVAGPAGALLVLSGVRRGMDALFLGAAWFGLFALPPVVSMKADWFALAPRFLYMTAAGVAMIWAGALIPVFSRAWHWWRVALLCLAVAVLLVPAGLFIREGMDLYHMAGESIWQASEAATDGQRMLFVNLPRRIAPDRRLYPIGFEGVTPLPMRVTADELVYVHTGVRNVADAVAFGVVATERPSAYTYELFGRAVGWQEVARAARATDVVYLTRYESGRIHLVEAGGVEGPPPDADLITRFGDRIDLLDASCACDQSGRVRLATWWRVGSDVDVDVSVFAHLVGAEDGLIAQADGVPLLGMMPFWLWEAGETVRDVRQFPEVEGGSYAIRFGIWEPATGARWSTSGGYDEAVTLRVQCP